MQTRFATHARFALRRGYTLFEVMLVMAIIVSVIGAAVPIFRNSFEVERMRKGADVLRTAWSKARLQAMTSGLTHVFRFEYQSDHFVVAVWDTGESETENSSATTVLEQPGELPEGITFHAAEKVVDARAAQADSADTQNAPQIFFYSDGTTSTAQVLITNNGERFIKVQLRGMTGISHEGDVVTADELQLEL
jgi:prepilin-type N-terminal cleavage/methylation domain-containing protein